VQEKPIDEYGLDLAPNRGTQTLLLETFEATRFRDDRNLRGKASVAKVWGSPTVRLGTTSALGDAKQKNRSEFPHDGSRLPTSKHRPKSGPVNGFHGVLDHIGLS
jgi:hypothetical protein